MSWQIRHEGSPRAVRDVTLEQVESGLRDGLWEPTDEVMGPGDKAWVAIENHPRLAEPVADLEPPPRKGRDEGTHLDMNALIDVCLVLLIFFILTTTYATAVQKVVPLPTLQSAEGKKVRVVSVDDVKKRMIRLQAQLDKSGRPVLRLENQTIAAVRDDGALDQDRLRDALRPYVLGDDGKREIIFDSREVSWGFVIAVQDAAKSAGIRTIHHLLRKQTNP